ncbi:helix-turn-helix transcriptional regulator, partial [Komagataeibacter oboediens]
SKSLFNVKKSRLFHSAIPPTRTRKMESQRRPQYQEVFRTLQIGGISQKVLSQVLKNLERDGLVLRTVHATVPVAVEYSLTSLGETLTQAVASLTHWAEQHMEEVQEAQLRYDGKRIDG